MAAFCCKSEHIWHWTLSQRWHLTLPPTETTTNPYMYAQGQSCTSFSDRLEEVPLQILGLGKEKFILAISGTIRGKTEPVPSNRIVVFGMHRATNVLGLHPMFFGICQTGYN